MSRPVVTYINGRKLMIDIFAGVCLGVLGGGIYKYDCWRDKKKTREFYHALEKGQISVIGEEE